MSIRTAILCAVFFCIPAATLRAVPFSVTAPGQPILDEAVVVISIAIPPGFQQVQVTEVQIDGFSHQSPGDVDIFLVNPFGALAEIMSDRGGSFAVSNLTLAFTDTAGGPASQAGPLVSGMYRPEGLHEGTDGGLASLTTLIPASDSWQLVLIDDSPGADGSVTSVTLIGEGVPVGVPSVSAWGLVVLILTGLTAGTILFKPGRSHAMHPVRY